MNAQAMVSFVSTVPHQQPRRVAVIQKEYNHELVRMDIDYDVPDAKRYASGTLLSMQWGYPPRGVQEFVGYVNHVEPLQGSDPADVNRRPLRVTCVGSSFPMKDAGYEAWRDMTGPQAAARIASKFRLFLAPETHQRVFPTLNQQGQSYWAFLVATAKAIGFTTYVVGTEMKFHPRNISPARMGGKIPRFSGPHGDLKTVLEFKPILGVAGPAGGEKAVREAYGVDPRSGQVIYAQTGSRSRDTLGAKSPDALFTRPNTEAVAHNLSEATMALSAQDAEQHWFMEARARLVGNPNVVPGGMVYLDGLSGDPEGYWYVKEAVHTIEPNAYITEAILGRDAIGASALPPPRTLPASTPAGTILVSHPPSTVVNGKWTSAWGAPR